MTDDNLKDTSNQNPNNTGPAVVGRKNFMQDPLATDNREDKDEPKLREKHGEVKISPTSDDIKPDSKSETPQPESSDDEPKSTVDDSIVDSKVPPPPNLTVDSPAAKLIKEKTYRLPIHHGGSKTALKVIVIVCFIACVIAGAIYILV